ncbi:MAG: outer membrane protein assembly factor BamB family protein [Planctomycetota bacterium]
MKHARLLRLSLCCLIVLGGVSFTSHAADWPSFRGPLGNGITAETGFPLQWSPEKNIRWKLKLPNRGNESPIVSNGRVFVTSATDKGTERRLHCVDRKTGDLLWTKAVSVDADEPTHQTNPFGAATPAATGERVVVWHGSAGLYCYDFDGNELWRRDLGKVGHIWGYGSSPVIHGDRVFLNFGPGDEQFLAAISLQNGEVLWRYDEPGGNNDRQGRMVGSWSTPVIADVGGAQQLLCSMPTRVIALSPDAGSLLWSCDGIRGKNGDLVYTSPLISKGVGIAMGGYTGPALAFRLDAAAAGDITATHRLWHDEQKHPQRIGSGVILGEHVFMANAGPGIIQCLEVSTGKELWKDRGAGANHWGSIVSADGRLYVTNQKGTTVVFAPNTEKFERLAENPLGEPSNSTPAFSNGEIFIRTDGHLWCIASE